MSTKHRPRKRFGQNFLHDPGIIDRIVSAIAPTPGDSLLEIGPGQGALTEPVLARAGKLAAIEIDRDLQAELSQRFGEDLQLINADALRVDLGSLGLAEPLKIFGNLPYNISTPLLFHCLAQNVRIERMVFMLQKEVVERIAAVPGNKQYGRLSVWMQFHCQARMLFKVPPGAFHPPPKVDSAVFELRPHAEPPFAVGTIEALETVLRAAFSQRRKTLQNGLKQVLDAEAIKTCDIDPQVRAEQLEPAAFGRLSQALAAQESA